MLRDPEIEVQNKAVDVIVKANHPETVKYLVMCSRMKTNTRAAPRWKY